jgi:electron transport complex protein RnfG
MLPDHVRIGLILMAICAAATALLAGTNELTREPIAATKREEMLRTLAQVLPPGFTNAPDRDTVTLVDSRLNRKGTPVVFHRAAKGKEYLGVAFVVTAPDGYAGEISVMMSVRMDGTIQNVSVLSHKETPGLGDKIQKPEWTGRFQGKSLQNARWGVKKDGGEFDQFAGATITPRAVVNAVHRGLEFFAGNTDRIFARKEAP